MATDTEICNLALSHLGIGVEISDLTTDRSQEGRACRTFIDVARETTLRSFAWPFATRFLELSLVEEDPTNEWSFSYRYPSDCVMLRRIISGTRNDDRQARVPYKLGQDDDGKLIYTDMEEAEVEYTRLEDDPSFYPADFVLAFSYQLGHLIAARVTGGDPYKKGTECYQFFLREISRAEANSANEEQAEETPDSEFIRGRE